MLKHLSKSHACLKYGREIDFIDSLAILILNFLFRR